MLLLLLSSFLLFLFLSLLLFWLLEVQLKDVVDNLLLVDRLGLFPLHQSVLGVLRENLAGGRSELPNDNLWRDYLIDKVPKSHLDHFDTPQHMRPSNAVDDELVDFLRALLQETAIVSTVVCCFLVYFAVLVFLFLCLCVPLLLLFFLFDVHIHS